MQRLFFSLTFVLLLVSSAWAKPPRLIVLIVVDQMRADYVQRFATDFTPLGFGRFFSEGLYFSNAAYDFAATKTAPGHVLLSSGLYPFQSGIVGNEWYDMERHRIVSAADRAPAADGRVALQWFVGTSFAQRVHAKYPGARVYSVSHKARAALLLTGPGQDDAFFVENKQFQGFFKTPAWLVAINEQLNATHYFRKKYTGDAVDAGIGRVAQALLTTEKLGHNPAGAPDILAVSFSGTDYVGHRFGPDSPEIRQALKRVDQEIAQLLTLAEKQVGKGRLLAVLTSDHGVTPVPEEARQQGRDAGRMRFPISMSLGQDFVEAISQPFVYLNTTKIKVQGKSVDQVIESVRQKLLAVKGVQQVLTDAEIRKTSPLLTRSLYPGRSGDLYVVLKPGWIFSIYPSGTTHGQPTPDDQQVPLAFWGYGLPARQNTETVSPARIAPTLLRALDIPAPDLQVPITLNSKT